MRLHNVTFDDDENPDEFTVSLTRDEAALLYAFTANVSPKAVSEAYGDLRWGEALYTAADGLGGLFNRFYENGAWGVIPSMDLVARLAALRGSTA